MTSKRDFDHQLRCRKLKATVPVWRKEGEPVIKNWLVRQKSFVKRNLTTRASRNLPESTVAILGPGLLGGSLIKALKKQKWVNELRVWGRDASKLDDILKRGWAQYVSTDVTQVVQNADIIVLCTPIEVMPELVQQMVPHIKPNALVTDVGSAKDILNQKIAPLLEGKARWVGSHPMAGSEKKGINSSKALLFKDATIFITPTPDTQMDALLDVTRFWKKLSKGKIAYFPPDKHDFLVAQISHLPHLIASAIIASTSFEGFQYHGNGFLDTTRIAAAPPSLWQGIFLENQPALLQSLQMFEDAINHVRYILEKQDQKALLKWLNRASRARAKISPRKKHKKKRSKAC